MKFFLILILVLSLGTRLPLIAQDWQEVYDQALSAYNDNQLVEAIEAAEKALELAETQFGISSEPFSYSAQLLSVACYEAGRFSKGIQSAQSEMESNRLGQVHDTTYAKAVGNLILNYQGAGQVNDAIPMIRQQLQIYGQHFGEESLLYNVALSDLAALAAQVQDSE